MRRDKRSTWLLSMIALTLILQAGCTLQKRVASVGNTYLEDVDITKKEDNLPFAHSWIDPNVNGNDYSKVFIKPIRTDLIPAADWKNSSSSVIATEADYKRETGEIAKYFHEQIIEELRNNPKSRYKLVNQGGANTLVIQIVVTELEFSHPAARAASLAIPVPGTGAAISAISDPHIAIAVRVTDGATGRLIATVADRKFPPTRIIDLNKLTVTSSAREVCSIWAQEIAEAINADRLTKVENRGSYSLKPW